MDIDQDKLMDFLHKFVGDLGATIAGGQRGHRRPARPVPGAGGAADAARRAGRRHRDRAALRRRVAARPAAGGYLEYDAAAGTYSMTPEQAFALTNPDGAVFVPGAFQLALGTLQALPRVTEAFRDRGWPRLARARRRRVRRLRALLPARVRR